MVHYSWQKKLVRMYIFYFHYNLSLSNTYTKTKFTFHSSQIWYSKAFKTQLSNVQNSKATP